MGLYDRDYYREEERSGIHLAANWSAVTTLIAVNVAIAVVGDVSARSIGSPNKTG